MEGEPHSLHTTVHIHDKPKPREICKLAQTQESGTGPNRAEASSLNPLVTGWLGWSLGFNGMEGLAPSKHSQWPGLFLENDLQAFPFSRFQIKIPSRGISQKKKIRRAEYVTNFKTSNKHI